MDSQAGGQTAAADCDFDALADSGMYDRYRATLTQYEIDATTAGVLTVALFGGTPREVHGRRIRGQIHAGLISEATTNTANLLAYLDRITPGARRANGTGASYSGLFADARHDLDLGIVLQDETETLLLEHPTKLKPKTLTAFEQLLETGEYTFTKSGIHETVETDANLIFVDEPTYGRWDGLSTVRKQIPYPPGLMQNFDFLVLDNNPDGETAGDVDAEPLDPAAAETYLQFAQTEVTPTLSENARDSFTNQFQSLAESFSDRDPFHEMVPKPTAEAVARTADALARLRLSETVIPDDVARATDFHESVLNRIYQSEPDDDEYDADTVETGRSKAQRDRIKNLKQLIAEIEEDYREGAPVHEVMARADEIGMEQSKVEHEIDKLKQKGEAYEPSTDHLRTT